jgi:hypothetical protein
MPRATEGPVVCGVSLPSSMTFEEMEARLRARLEALPAAARAELLHVLP